MENDDYDSAPLASFMTRYSPAGALPVDVHMASINARQLRPGILSERSDKEEATDDE